MNSGKKEMKFRLDKKTPIVLYGAATIGNLLYKHFTQNGYEVKGFIDMRAGEIKDMCGVPVYGMDDGCLSRDFVIVIAVKNVWEHGRIADELIKRGFYRLVFRPYACLEGKGGKEEKELNSIYDKLTDLTKENVFFEGDVPLADQYYHREWSVNILEETEEAVTIFVPVTLLYTDKKDGVPEFPVLFLKPHLQFIKYVMGMEGGSVKDYMQYCLEGASKVGGFETTDAWKENVIRSRAEVYIKMNHMYNLERDFFIRQAPHVHWNIERKYFNLQSGKHRVTFLAAKGDNYVAVKMTKGDYADWIRENLAKETGDFLEGQCRSGKAVPVEHPFFYEYSCLEEQFWYQLIRKMMEKVSEEYYVDSGTDLLKGKKFLVSLYDDGFVKRFLKRCGFEVFVQEQDNIGEIEIKINEMLGFNSMGQISEHAIETYEYALVGGSMDKYREVCSKSRRVFWVSGEEYKDLNRIMTGIYEGKKVSVYFINGHMQ